jgi:glucose-1-phosphatase
MSDIKAIIFDLGKVVFDLSFERVFESWAVSSGMDVAVIKDKFLFDEVFEKFERNEISPGQFRSLISHRLGMQLTDEEFDKGWCNLYLDPYEGVDNLLKNLKQNYKLVALTNTNAIHNAIWRDKYAEQLQHFEEIFSSHELGVRKPEDRIYKIVMDYLNLLPEQTLFLDDNIDNVNGAAYMGIISIVVSTQDQMREDFRRLEIAH